MIALASGWETILWKDCWKISWQCDFQAFEQTQALHSQWNFKTRESSGCESFPSSSCWSSICCLFHTIWGLSVMSENDKAFHIHNDLMTWQRMHRSNQYAWTHPALAVLESLLNSVPLHASRVSDDDAKDENLHMDEKFNFMDTHFDWQRELAAQIAPPGHFWQSRNNLGGVHWWLMLSTLNPLMVSPVVGVLLHGKFWIGQCEEWRWKAEKTMRNAGHSLKTWMNLVFLTSCSSTILQIIVNFLLLRIAHLNTAISHASPVNTLGHLPPNEGNIGACSIPLLCSPCPDGIDAIYGVVLKPSLIWTNLISCAIRL